MTIPLVMTLLGQDRPGLVQRVASLVNEHGGNWLESRMSHLGGHFAGILRVQIPKEQESALVRSLERLDAEGLTVVVHADANPPSPTGGKPALLEIVGHDRPGIVRQISNVLAEQHVNVEELDTQCTSAPMSGEPIFQARARLQLPPSCDLERLRLELERIAADLLVECKFEEVSGQVLV